MDSELYYYEKYKDSEKGRLYQKMSKEKLMDHMFKEEIFQAKRNKEEKNKVFAAKEEISKKLKSEIYKQIEKENPVMIEALTGVYKVLVLSW